LAREGERPRGLAPFRGWLRWESGCASGVGRGRRRFVVGWGGESADGVRS